MSRTNERTALLLLSFRWKAFKAEKFEHGKPYRFATLFFTVIAAICAQTHHIARRTILCCRRNARKRTKLGDIKSSEKKKRNKKNWNKAKIEYFAIKNQHSSRKTVFACVGRTRRHFPLFISVKSRTIFSYFNRIVKPNMSWVVCTT